VAAGVDCEFYARAERAGEGDGGEFGGVGVGGLLESCGGGVVRGKRGRGC